MKTQNKRNKTLPHTTTIFHTPTLDLEGHQSLQLETTPKTAQHGKSKTIP